MKTFLSSRLAVGLALGASIAMTASVAQAQPQPMQPQPMQPQPMQPQPMQPQPMQPQPMQPQPSLPLQPAASGQAGVDVGANGNVDLVNPQMIPAPEGSKIAQPGTPILMPPGYLQNPGRWPRRVDWDQDLPVPVGYHLGEESLRGVWIGGASMFFSVYGVTAIVGGAIAAAGEPKAGLLFIPFAGPTAFMVSEKAGAGAIMSMTILGLIQGAGFGMLIGGAVATHKVYLRNDVAIEVPTPSAVPEVKLGAGSASLNWSF